MDNGNPVPSIAELGHVGVRCFDTEAQVRFYTTILGLTVTDHDPELGTWFLSARPGSEHHELLLTGGRDAAREARLIQQISFRCPGLADVADGARRYGQDGYVTDDYADRTKNPAAYPVPESAP